MDFVFIQAFLLPRIASVPLLFLGEGGGEELNVISHKQSPVGAATPWSCPALQVSPRGTDSGPSLCPPPPASTGPRKSNSLFSRVTSFCCQEGEERPGIGCGQPGRRWPCPARSSMPEQRCGHCKTGSGLRGGRGWCTEVQHPARVPRGVLRPGTYRALDQQWQEGCTGTRRCGGCDSWTLLP